MNNIAQNFDYRQKNNNLVIYINEPIDIASSSYFERGVSALINNHPDNNVVLNMAEVPFMNSAGLGVLIVLTKKLQEKNCTLKLTNLNPSIRKVISLLDAEDLVNVFDDELEALS